MRSASLIFLFYYITYINQKVEMKKIFCHGIETKKKQAVFSSLKRRSAKRQDLRGLLG
jgi:hypothetical protein